MSEDKTQAKEKRRNKQKKEINIHKEIVEAKIGKIDKYVKDLTTCQRILQKELEKNKETLKIKEIDPYAWSVPITLTTGFYKGHTYELMLSFIKGDAEKAYIYPFSAPMVKISPPAWHVNISEKSGYICVDTLADNWSPTTRVSNIVGIVTLLLQDKPNLESPMNKEARDLYVKSQDEYKEMVNSFYKKNKNI